MICPGLDDKKKRSEVTSLLSVVSVRYFFFFEAFFVFVAAFFLPLIRTHLHPQNKLDDAA